MDEPLHGVWRTRGGVRATATNPEGSGRQFTAGRSPDQSRRTARLTGPATALLPPTLRSALSHGGGGTLGAGTDGGDFVTVDAQGGNGGKGGEEGVSLLIPRRLGSG
jgi:hypothetical protein